MPQLLCVVALRWLASVSDVWRGVCRLPQYVSNVQKATVEDRDPFSKGE